MADEKPGLHIDSDWKKQAQEEKKRLVEAEAQRKSAAPVQPAGVVPTASAAARSDPRAARTRERQLPPASFDTLVQSLTTQVLYYLGEINGESPNLDMAKHQLDTMTMIEAKTQNNLSPQEQQHLDAALYETRMRYISVAEQFI